MPGRVVQAPPPGRREQKKAMTRAELVRAGRALFSSAGIYEARIEDLSDRAGIGKGTLYLYFSNKQDLVRAVMEDGLQELGLRAEEAVAGARSYRDVVDSIVRAHIEFFDANPDLLRIFHQVRGVLKFHHEDWLPLRATLEQHIEHIARLLARVPSTVRGRPARRRATALALFGAVSGACSVRSTLNAGPAPETWASLLRAFLSGLSVEEPRPGSRRSRPDR